MGKRFILGLSVCILVGFGERYINLYLFFVVGFRNRYRGVKDFFFKSWELGGEGRMFCNIEDSSCVEFGWFFLVKITKCSDLSIK